MSKRRLRQLAFDAEHYRLMRAYKIARGGEKLTALRRLQAYVADQLRG